MNVPLLARMQRDLRERASLQSTTVALMYAAYGVHALVTAVALRKRWLPLPLRRGAARCVGGSLVGLGVGFCLLGVGRFTGAGQVSGTCAGLLITDGVYRYSRNPQYLGYVLALAGGAIARRSGAGLMLAATAGTVFAIWIPAEEEHMAAVFETDYSRYRRQTLRWLGTSPSSRGRWRTSREDVAFHSAPG